MREMTEARGRMVDIQIAGRGIRDRHVLEAMKKVPREAFIARDLQKFAYRDGPLQIGHGQTISQPYIVALMIEAAEVRPGDRVLEIGAGSGYAAAVVGEIAETVHAIERHEPLGRMARANLAEAGVRNVEIHVADGTLGWPDAAPFDAILVAAGGPRVPDSLRNQLNVGGRLVMPVGDTANGQSLWKITRTGPENWDEVEVEAVCFVPLIGAQGWPEQGRRSAGGGGGRSPAGDARVRKEQ